MVKQQPAPFRFDKSTNSLFEYLVFSRVYLFCFKTRKATTLRGATNEYYYSQEMRAQRAYDAW